VSRSGGREFLTHSVDFASGFIKYRVIERICHERADSPSRIFKRSEKVTEEQPTVTVPANASLDLHSDYCSISPPTGQKPITIDPVVNRESKKFHELLFCGFISGLCHADKQNANDFPGAPVGLILR
jgi:hypothetical protein